MSITTKWWFLIKLNNMQTPYLLLLCMHSTSRHNQMLTCQAAFGGKEEGGFESCGSEGVNNVVSYIREQIITR